MAPPKGLKPRPSKKLRRAPNTKMRTGLTGYSFKIEIGPKAAKRLVSNKTRERFKKVLNKSFAANSVEPLFLGVLPHGSRWLDVYV